MKKKFVIFTALMAMLSGISAVRCPAQDTSVPFDALHGSDDATFAISCWRLSSIRHPSGKKVSFNYQTASLSNVSPVITADHLTISDAANVRSYRQWIDDPENYSDVAILYNTILTKRLSSIDFAGRGSASLSWNAQGKLASIKVLNADGRVLKECSLGYYIPLTSSGARHATLAFLTSVSLSGEGTYRMSYDSADDSHIFPAASMTSDNELWYTDAYGYYNGGKPQAALRQCPKRPDHESRLSRSEPYYKPAAHTHGHHVVRHLPGRRTVRVQL